MKDLQLPDPMKLSGRSAPPGASGVLGRAFVFPPFSVLDARAHAWKVRKKQWLALGIKSEIGRGTAEADVRKKSAGINGLAFHMTPGAYDGNAKAREVPRLVQPAATIGGGSATGTSVFDPVLCELLYRWFCPPNGQIIDPFAGGSVRGIVASVLGLRYWGCDLSEQQIMANRAQGQEICKEPKPDDLTPVEKVSEVWVKRDDLFRAGGAPGGKARTCLRLAESAKGGLVTAGSRHSPQVHIVALIGKLLGLSVRCHVPEGEDTTETLGAAAAGAVIVRQSPGHNSVIIARAREDAAKRGWREIPFGMEHKRAIQETGAQVANLPADAKRLVVPVGSGMSLAGILHGLKREGRKLPVLGVVVGADPSKRLNRYAPLNWQSMAKLVPAGTDYHRGAEETQLGDIELDPHYEAKCLPHLRDGDVLWVVGIRPSMHRDPVSWVAGDARVCVGDAPEADFILTCPPYGNLESYSDHPDDLSTYEYPQFREALSKIIARSVDRLKQNRFAAIVVGEFRGEGGGYHGFVGDTVRMFQRTGCTFHNDAILLTPVGSLPVRTGRQFAVSRKMGKCHQNILVFCKGDPVKAAKAVQGE